ncbi:hypothetical protein VNO77_44677 [Canavalia gladiata]|uniref:Uncharacterized protein n=1 Tax=Canavalia gladiata TaxID=3824 RepID=A0AAN9PQY5_CANGL
MESIQLKDRVDVGAPLILNTRLSITLTHNTISRLSRSTLLKFGGPLSKTLSVCVMGAQWPSNFTLAMTIEPQELGPYDQAARDFHISLCFYVTLEPFLRWIIDHLSVHLMLPIEFTNELSVTTMLRFAKRRCNKGKAAWAQISRRGATICKHTRISSSRDLNETMVITDTQFVMLVIEGNTKVQGKSLVHDEHLVLAHTFTMPPCKSHAP